MTSESTTTAINQPRDQLKHPGMLQTMSPEFHPDMYINDLLEFANTLPNQPELISDFKSNFAEKLRITDAELLQLKPTHYLIYLRACEYCNLDIAFNHIQVIANRYLSDFEMFQKLSQENPDQYNEMFTLALECAEQTRHLIWLFSQNSHNTLPSHIIEQLFALVQHPSSLIRMGLSHIGRFGVFCQ